MHRGVNRRNSPFQFHLDVIFYLDAFAPQNFLPVFRFTQVNVSGSNTNAFFVKAGSAQRFGNHLAKRIFTG
jgi:hypothetical protein